MISDRLQRVVVKFMGARWNSMITVEFRLDSTLRSGHDSEILPVREVDQKVHHDLNRDWGSWKKEFMNIQPA